MLQHTITLVKLCPKCDAAYDDGAVFCETDGERLPGGPPGMVGPVEDRPTLTRLATGACPSCGAEAADAVDGYCGSCGHRTTERETLSILPIGATIAGRVVVGGRTEDDFIARETDGREVLLVIGGPAVLAVEAAAAKMLAKTPLFPRFVEIGDDPRRGAFLALSAPPATAEPLGDVAGALSIARAIAMLRTALSAVKAAEDANLEWQPDATDFYVEEGALFAARVRVSRLSTSRADAKRVMATIGRAFLPMPGTRGPVRLVRMLVEHGPDAPSTDHSVDAMRAELDLVERELSAPPEAASLLGGTCDPGLKRNHNEDAFAIASGVSNGEPWAVLVVCDGVSSSTHAEQASRIGSKTACDALAHFARSGDIAYEAAPGAMTAAIRSAHVAICVGHLGMKAQEDGPSRSGSSEPPGTTIVAALVYRRRLTLGWIGDSRAYWVSTSGGELLTRDHSWVNEAVERGEMSEEEALRQPLAHALTHCIGPLENETDAIQLVEPEVRARDLAGPGRVVLCSDGLWNYFPNAAQIADHARSAGSGATPSSLARYMVNHALARGGGDNVTVAIFEQK